MVQVASMLIEFIYFLIVVILLLYIPGCFLLFFAKYKFSFLEKIFLSIVLGIISFTILMYTLSWVKLEILIYPILLAIVIYSYSKRLFVLPSLEKNQRIYIVVVICFSVLFSLQMILNGNFGDSIYFFGDDMAHLGYISELRLGTMPHQHPAVAGIEFKGYHFFYDYFIAKLSNVTLLSHISLYFHFLPLLTALGWGFGTYTFVLNCIKKQALGLWSVFFVLFGSSFGYFLFFLGHKNTMLSTNLGIDQPMTALLNAPYSFSVVLVITVLLLMSLYYKRRNLVLLVFISVIVGVSFIFKVYSGIILTAGLAVFVAIELIKKNYSVILAPIIAGVTGLLTFGLFIVEGSSLFILPLWPLERITDELFPEYGYMERLTTYSKHGVLHGLISTYLFSFTIFIIGNLGTRLFGLLIFPFIYIKERRWPPNIVLIILTMLLTSICMPLIFAQTIKVFEMIQIAWYYPVLASVLAGIGISHLFSLKFNGILKGVIFILILALTLPLAIYSTIHNVLSYARVERQSLSNEYFQSMKYLKDNGSYDDVVLELPLNLLYVDPTKTLAWFRGTSSHIPAFGEKRSFLGNQYIEFPNMPISERVQFISDINKVEFAKKKDNAAERDIIEKIKKNNITFVYSTERVQMFENNPNIKIVYKNNSSVIYKFN